MLKFILLAATTAFLISKIESFPAPPQEPVRIIDADNFEPTGHHSFSQLVTKQFNHQDGDPSSNGESRAQSVESEVKPVAIPGDSAAQFNSEIPAAGAEPQQLNQLDEAIDQPLQKQQQVQTLPSDKQEFQTQALDPQLQQQQQQQLPNPDEKTDKKPESKGKKVLKKVLKAVFSGIAS